MRICYIKYAENIDEYINYSSKINLKSIRKFISLCKKMLKFITVKPIGDGIIFYLPNRIKNKSKLANKIIKKLQYYNISNVVIEKRIRDESFKNKLYESNINILDGRWLFNYLSIEIIEYIARQKNEYIENQEVSILVNDLNEVVINNIYELATKVKRLNIITNNIDKLKKIEEKLYKEKGIIITLSNNKRKSIAKAKIILNIDFPEEIINKYNINKKAIIINIETKINIESKSFDGININYYNLQIDENNMRKFLENNMYEAFDKNILYESIIYDKHRYQTIKEKIKKDKIEIKELIGNNGAINQKEFKQNL